MQNNSDNKYGYDSDKSARKADSYESEKDTGYDDEYFGYQHRYESEQSRVYNKKRKSPAKIIVPIVIIAAAAIAGILLAMNFLKPAGSGTETAAEAQAEEIRKSDAPAKILGDENSTGEYEVSDEAMAKVITYKGKEYKKKDNIRTILFMGTDASEDRVEPHETIGNGPRSDTIVLFVLDDNTGEATLVAVSRDTMTDVDVYDANGEFLYSGPMQLTLQYTFGDSAKRSCWLMKNKVSELLYGDKIDGYLSMTMDGIALIVDLLGGITAELPEDYTYIDEAYTKGATVTFDGKAAEQFIRYRDLNQLESNDIRMERQTWFMQQMFETLGKSPDKADLISSLLDKADRYIETDLEAEAIRDMASYDLLDETLKVPGESKAGDGHAEYYVDEDALQDMLIELYYEPA